MSTRLSASMFNVSSSNVSYDLPAIYIFLIRPARNTFTIMFMEFTPGLGIYADYVYGIHSY